MINYRLYPANWTTDIRPRILARAGQILAVEGSVETEARCEWCHVENHAKGVRYPDGRFEPFTVEPFDNDLYEVDGARIITIVLTIAHLDQDKENHRVGDDRLAALCQRCHLNYDRKHNLEVQRAYREARKGPLLIPDLPTSGRE